MATRQRTSLFDRLRAVYHRRQTLQWLSKLVPPCVVLLGWELASGVIVPAAILPPFTATLREIVAFAQSPQFISYAFDTLFRGIAGIVVAVLLATPVGLAMARDERIRRNVDPIISLTYPVPKSPLIPLVIFWLGMGNLSRITLAVVGSFLPVLLSAYNGANGVNRELLWSARSMGLSTFEEVYKVVLPASLPTLMTGIRIGLIFSFIIIVSSEMIMAQTGLGVLVVNYGQFGQYAKVFGVVFWIAVLVSIIDRLYILLSQRLLIWSEHGVSGL